MLWWIPYAMVRIAIVFASGIIAAIAFPSLISGSALATGAIVFFTLFVVARRLPPNHPHRPALAGINGLAVVFLTGYGNLLVNTESSHPDHFTRSQDPIVFYTGTIGIPERRALSTRAVITLDEIYSAGEWKKASGKILLTFPNDAPPYSARVMIRGPVLEVPGVMNPGEFDFRKYLRQKNIAHRQTVNSGDLAVLEPQTDHGLQYYSHRASLWASGVIRHWIRDGRAQAITQALVLGIAGELDADLQDAYSASGATHVLSVSGLHVGIIYAIVVLLLKPLQFFSWSRWATAAAALFCLWAYAFVTGLSPSVLRAVLMCSFVVAGGPFRRETNISNTLAASAFLLLTTDPWLIESIGFQLSYLAVAGIVWLQKPIYSCWQMKSYLGDKVWQVTAVSLAAQATTFVLGLYYFHQFPVYFLISNLIVIPLSTAVLVAGISLLLVSSIGFAAEAVSWVIGLMIKLLNGSVFMIENLPGSVVDSVFISSVQCVTLMGIVITLTSFIRRRNIKYLLAAILPAAVFGVLQWRHHIQDVRKDRLIVYAVPGQTAFARLHNGQAWIYGDSTFFSDHRSDRRHLLPSRIETGIGKITSISLPPPNTRDKGRTTVLRWHGRTIVYGSGPGFIPSNSMYADYLILGHQAVRSLHDLSGKIRFNSLILDGSVGRVLTDKLLEEASEMKITVYAVRYRGAFVTPL